MAWRTVYITQPAKLSVSRKALVVTTQERVSIPFDDIAVIVIENPQVILTAGVLREAAEAGAVVVGCDAKQHPSGVYLPHHRHSRLTGQLRLQLSWSAPFKKRLHQQLIKNKVHNQGWVLRAYHPTLGKELIALGEQVQSGDKTRIEAHCAAKYFKALFGGAVEKAKATHPEQASHKRRFTRELEVVENAALNYGYAILRAAIARGIVAYGMNPALGLFHENELNAYNLADDLLEPFRPLVDSEVKARWGELEPVSEENFGVAERSELLKLLNAPVITLNPSGGNKNGESRSVLNAIEELVRSLVTASTKKKFRKLSFGLPSSTAWTYYR